MNRLEILKRSVPRSSLLRYKDGRIVMPSLGDFDPMGLVQFNDDDMNAIMKEVLRRRRRWRIVYAVRGIFLFSLFFWTFILMPRAAVYMWPFD